ncbi:hypothetical protein A0256_21765 [Mucilaginibacter sp. PAMC 26640]|nr:hypothetical protein A0256_21765 [Mucilaginibacter sp. PAMC 26640]
MYRSEDVNSDFASSEYFIDVNPRKLRYISHGENSMVTFLSENIVIDKQGYYTPQGGLLFEGYMGWEQVADLLPLEFGD